MTVGELLHEQCDRSSVHEKLPIERIRGYRPRSGPHVEPGVPGGLRVWNAGVGRPRGGVIHKHINGTERSLGLIEQQMCTLCVGEVRLTRGQWRSDALQAAHDLIN